MAIFVPHAKLAALLGKSQLRSDAGTLGELLAEIERLVGTGEWEKERRATVLINGRAAHHLGGRRARLGPEDEVWMVWPSAGG